LGQAGVDAAGVGNSALAFIPVRRIQEEQLLARENLRGQHQERAMSADGHGEGFFLKGPLVRRFSANHHRHIQQHAFASPLSRLRHAKFTSSQ
jgi:hypothetical protein